MKIIILFISVIISSAWGDILEHHKFIGRIARKDQTTFTLNVSTDKRLTAHLASSSLQSTIDHLLPGDEVIVEGHMEYVSSFSDSRITYTPVFVIEKLRPISLKRLRVSDTKMEENFRTVMTDKFQDYSPSALTVSTEVSSSLILTASVLLLQTLIAPATEPGVRTDLSRGLTLFAGTLATGVILFDDFH